MDGAPVEERSIPLGKKARNPNPASEAGNTISPSCCIVVDGGESNLRSRGYPGQFNWRTVPMVNNENKRQNDPDNAIVNEAVDPFPCNEKPTWRQRERNAGVEIPTMFSRGVGLINYDAI